MKKKHYFFATLLLTWMSNMTFAQYPDLNCKAQSWNKFDNSAPTYSGETKAERKQKYCDAAVKELADCYSQISQIQYPEVKKQDRWVKRLNKYGAKIDRKKAAIRRKYCPNSNN